MQQYAVDLYSDTPDPAHRRHAQGHGRRRGRRRAAAPRSRGHGAVRRGGRAPRPRVRRCSCPTGTMCNLIAVATHVRQGDAVVMEHLGHVLRSETGGIGVVAGAVVDTVRGERGIFTAAQLEPALAPGNAYRPPATLVCLEQTHNFGGGSVWPLAGYHEVVALAHDRGRPRPPRRCPPVQRRRRQRRARRGVEPTGRQRLGRLHQGTRRAAGRRARRAARVRRGGVDVEAPPRWRHAPGGHRGRRVPLRARQPRRPAGRRPRPRHRAGSRPRRARHRRRAGRDEHGVVRRRRRWATRPRRSAPGWPTAVFASPAPAAASVRSPTSTSTTPASSSPSTPPAPSSVETATSAPSAEVTP